MKKTISLLLTLFFLLTLLVSCGETEEDTPSGMQLATVDGCEFRLYIPMTWNKNTAYGISGGYFSLTQISSVSVEKYTPDDFTSVSELDFFERECLPTVKNILQPNSITEYETSDTTLGLENAKRITLNGTYGESSVSCVFLVAKHNDAIYVLTYMMDEDLEESQEENGGNIISNFRFDTVFISDDYQKHLKKATNLPDDMQVASDEKAKFTFFVPSDWNVNLEEEIASAKYVDNANVSLVPWALAEEQMRLSDYFPMVDSRLTELYGENYHLTSSMEIPTETTMAGRTAYQYDYTIKDGENTFALRQIVCAYNGTVYALTYTAGQSVFNLHLEEVAEMAEELRFD